MSYCNKTFCHHGLHRNFYRCLVSTPNESHEGTELKRSAPGRAVELLIIIPCRTTASSRRHKTPKKIQNHPANSQLRALIRSLLEQQTCSAFSNPLLSVL
ncbi:hypothetical protein M758_1G322500 [Ceratodon purpureus]|uniref:Uncharacterized protein n=1 Tax=Ceratodon purpureus TaxID=3225 RepID=A0A8T0JBZ8_CERPU|nr:hypothetical protein KC19_1G329900 [Ceratodon purpureus]KAG0632370.1 hypothetical protein M758_1G322500 [Ceratodon purpureus]